MCAFYTLRLPASILRRDTLYRSVRLPKWSRTTQLTSMRLVRSTCGALSPLVPASLDPVSPDLKLLLMSASLDGGAAELFADYFGGAPVLSVPGRTFPVIALFLEHAVL